MYIDLVLASLALLPSSVSAAGLYTKGSAVLQVDGTSYDKLIAKSNYTSIVEFYAPWCGHCQNLKPAYEKAATSLAGIAKVAAVNCDEEINKPFCGSMGVQGFPTLKIVKPSKKKGKPVVEDYQGERTAKAINDAVLDKVANHVTKLKDDGLDTWLGTEASRPKALFFSEKGSVSPMVKALAIDFLGAIDVAHVQSTQKKTAIKYGVTSFPSVVLISAPEREPVKYAQDMKKQALLTFLSQAASPNPDALPTEPENKTKSSTKKDTAKSSSKKSANAASSPAAEEPEAASVTLEADTPPTTSPDSKVSSDVPPPVRLPVQPAPKLMPLEDEAALQKTCLHHKASMCILAFTPADAAESSVGAEGTETTSAEPPEGAEGAETTATEPKTSEHAGLLHLREISHKHKQRGAKMFPFYSIPDTNPAGITLLQSLSPSKINTIEGFTLLAVNAKKGWWAPYSGNVVSRDTIESWVDDLRFGEITKEKLPEGVVSMIVEDVESTGEAFNFGGEAGSVSEEEKEKILAGLREKERKIKERGAAAAAAKEENAQGVKIEADEDSPIKIEVVELDEHDEL